MSLPSAHRPPALLESASQRVKLAARAAVERTIEGLGLAALASANVFQRDTLLGAQFELNRRSAMFALSFNEALDERVRRESAPRSDSGGFTSWDAMSLVDDQEVERKVSAERFGLEIAHACEWELRELDAYMGSLLGTSQDRNPLRPEIVGLALIRGIETTSERQEIRSLLLSELGRVLATEMRGTYTAIVADLRKAGVQPAGLSVRATANHGRHVSGYDSLSDEAGSGSAGTRHDAVTTGRSRLGPGTTSRGRLGGHSMGQVDARMMSIIRRLAHADGGSSGDGSGWSDSATGATLPPNLIRAHRDELRQAANGSLDHVVIDVIGTLFDQILSDPKVSPQMARQIGRLQLPVLRAALGDPSFFSSRRHPVRRFINRIASLAAAFDDFGADDAQRFLAQVRDLVQGIVDGDFEQIDLYEHKLAELERLVAELAQEEAQAQGDPGEVLARKEDEWLTVQRYAVVLQSELQGLDGPEFVRDFLTEVWSQVLVQAARRHGTDSDPFRRLRGIARELFMSVQPKGMPAQRKEFLARLPKLMQGLNEGMDLIGWPDTARKAFFGLLLPAHAESLKGQGLRTLDYNMLAKRLDNAFELPLPTPGAPPPPGTQLPVLNDAISAPRFSAEEAARVGLVDESRIDWSTPVSAVPQAEPPVTEVDINISGLPAPEPVEPTQGPELAAHVQLGFAYQMHLDGDWHKVKLTHVSPGRNFFVFSRGKRHRQTISLTQRMLVKLCETGRLRAFESAYLLERATARARRQLASLAAPA
ncbi:MAG: DUF1631 domain-containing protein [Rubrivivax sp.]|nr:DUF1631 domain-containing protein [Rubrivivax sp.]